MTRAHQREPVAAAAEHVRASPAGSASTSTPTRVSGVWPRTTAQTIAVMPGGEERPSADGQPGECLTHAARLDVRAGSGTGTLATIAVEDRGGRCGRSSTASTLGSSRWASTGRASAVHVVGEHVVAARASRRIALAARTRCSVARGEAPRVSSSERRVADGQRDGVPLHGVGDVDLADDADQLADLGGVGDRLEVVERVGSGVASRASRSRRPRRGSRPTPAAMKRSRWASGRA